MTSSTRPRRLGRAALLVGRTLAAPFVFTAAVSSAHADPVPAPAPVAPRIIRNPPPPPHRPLPVLDAGAPAPVDAGPILPAAAASDAVVRNNDGTCWVYTSYPCPAGVACNPPPPQQVQCPPAKPDAS